MKPLNLLLSPEFSIAMADDVIQAGLLYEGGYWDKSFGRMATVWYDPVFMMLMGFMNGEL